jgi:hypothetical protein
MISFSPEVALPPRPAPRRLTPVGLSVLGVSALRRARRPIQGLALPAGECAAVPDLLDLNGAPGACREADPAGNRVAPATAGAAAREGPAQAAAAPAAAVGEGPAGEWPPQAPPVRSWPRAIR